MKKLFPLFILIFSFAAFGQIEEPIIGKLSDIKRFTKVCIIAQPKKVRSAMINVLKKEKANFEVVNAAAAQFFLDLGTFGGKKNTSDTQEIELSAYYYNIEKRKVIVWRVMLPFLIGPEGTSLPAGALTRTFIRDLRRP